MKFSKPRLSGSVDRKTVQVLAKTLVAFVSLVVLLYIARLLPGVDRLVPQTPVTFAAAVGAVVTALLAGLLVFAAPKLASLTRMSFDGPEAVVENVASVVYWIVVLAAILVAHRGFAEAVVPLFGGSEWLYDIIFLLAALPVLTFIAVCLYENLDPTAELIAETVSGDSDGRS